MAPSKKKNLMDIFKKPSKSVCTWTIVVCPEPLWHVLTPSGVSWTIVVCPDPLSPASSTSSAMKTPENRRGPWWPQSCRWKTYHNGIIQTLVLCLLSIMPLDNLHHFIICTHFWLNAFRLFINIYLCSLFLMAISLLIYAFLTYAYFFRNATRV